MLTTFSYWKSVFRVLNIVYPPYSSHTKMVTGIFVNLNVLGFRSHLLPAISSCTKPLVLLLDITNWCVLPYYLNILIINTMV